MSPRSPSRPGSERRSARSDTSARGSSSIGTCTRRPSVVMTTATRRRSWRSKRPNSASKARCPHGDPVRCAQSSRLRAHVNAPPMVLPPMTCWAAGLLVSYTGAEVGPRPRCRLQPTAAASRPWIVDVPSGGSMSGRHPTLGRRSRSRWLGEPPDGAIDGGSHLGGAIGLRRSFVAPSGGTRRAKGREVLRCGHPIIADQAGITRSRSTSQSPDEVARRARSMGSRDGASAGRPSR